MKKQPYTQAAAAFPLSRRCRVLGLATAAVAGPVIVVSLALVFWFVLLLLDENSIIDISRAVQDQVVPMGLAALGGLAAISVPFAVLYSAWTATGRRDLYRTAGSGFEHKRPSDRQMRRFLKDAHPWEAAIMAVLLWAAAGTLVGGVAAAAIYFGGHPDERPLALLMLGLAMVSAAVMVVFIRVLRAVTALAAESRAMRERRWPLPSDSDLVQSLGRATSSDSGVGGVM